MSLASLEPRPASPAPPPPQAISPHESFGRGGPGGSLLIDVGGSASRGSTRSAHTSNPDLLAEGCAISGVARGVVEDR